MRPLRILRRVRARLRHWGRPHVHCPGCGADAPIPAPEVAVRCATCLMSWLRIDFSGDRDADWARVTQHIAEAPDLWTITWRPLLVDSPSAPAGSIGVPLEAAFLYRSVD